MTDAQFQELRAIQLAQLAMLESIYANVLLMTQHNQGTKAAAHNWDRALKHVESATAKLASTK